MLMKHNFEGEWLIMIEDQPVELANRLVIDGEVATLDGHPVEIKVDGGTATFRLGLCSYEVRHHAAEQLKDSTDRFAVTWRNGDGDDEISDTGVMDRASLWTDWKRDPNVPNVTWRLPVEQHAWVLKLRGMELAHRLTFKNGQVFEGETSVGAYDTNEGRLSAQIGRSSIVTEKMYSNMTDFAGELTTEIDGETRVETAHIALRKAEH